ncbi:hypothetical protein GCM10022236_46580 [Microlunatus ginsengisoli]|uniref:Uncharacterized protein n=1 Tax=Microlunatus ginsengisoli TaxID=363863 RepID=A0ABP7ASD4_9ACTN
MGSSGSAAPSFLTFRHDALSGLLICSLSAPGPLAQTPRLTSHDFSPLRNVIALETPSDHKIAHLSWGFGIGHYVVHTWARPAARNVDQ